MPVAPAVDAQARRHTVSSLMPLTADGHHLLADRRRSDSSRAQVDLVVVGPGGVFILLTKTWEQVSIRDGHLYCGQADVTDELMNLADLAYRAEGDLAAIGLAPGEVRPVVVLAGRSQVDLRLGPLQVVGERDLLRYLTDFGARLSGPQVEIVLERSLTLFDLAHAAAQSAVDETGAVVPDLGPDEDDEQEQHAESPGDRLRARGPARPIEEWMSFLQPAQAALVRRSFTGPARISGAVGTGKTIVGLHRAAYLARTRPGAVLVTSDTTALPELLRARLEQMAPETLGSVELSGVLDWALAFLNERGVAVRLDDEAADAVFAEVWRARAPEPSIARSQRARSYWQDEIGRVIKGRGITDLATYSSLPRTGRRFRLDLDQSRAVWALYEAYQAGLSARGIHDRADVILLAEAELRREPLTGRYASVIVDEAQDLSAVALRMLHSLVGDRTDGLTLIDDGRQALHPGGCTLAELGISVAERSVVMDTHHRSTAQILALAGVMVDGDEPVDLEGSAVAADAALVPNAAPRSGESPVVLSCRSTREREHAMVQRMRAVLREERASAGEIGVLCSTAKAAARTAVVLREAGLPVVLLGEHDGAPLAAIRVGTIAQAKGLDFRQVLLPEVTADEIAQTAPPEEPIEHERWRLRRRELYVGMTRAREGLWIGVL